MRKFFPILCMILLVSCTEPTIFADVEEYPPIYPDYVGVTIPSSMAPLKFAMADGRCFKATSEQVGDTIWTCVAAWQKGQEQGIRYKPFPIILSNDSIDPYLAYRLIEPGYEGWRFMGIYQRELSSYAETPIVTNRANAHGCMNCHTFHDGDANEMLFHARGPKGGTVVVNGNHVRLLDLATMGSQKQGTYPAWHPSGRYVAFSSNTTHQSFTLSDVQPVEVFDTKSDIILLDLQTDSVTTPSLVNTDAACETFPTWAPDGNTLYYCSADSVSDLPYSRAQLRYKLMSLSFANGSFQGEPREISLPDSMSVSFPRVSPDGQFLMFTATSFGTFPIWHREADLWMMHIPTGKVQRLDVLNSTEAESYHSWSSNGRWVVFGSRRIDGRYTRLFISHFNGQTFDKPFLLPQKDVQHDRLRLKSYNIPEFVKAKVKDRQRAITNLFD